MYRQSNDRFSQNANMNMNAMNAYPPPPPLPHHSMPKMHLDGFPPNIPPPLYYDPVQGPTYDYLQSNTNSLPPPENFERGFAPAWRDVSESKGQMPMNSGMGPPPPIHNVSNVPNMGGHYDVRTMPSNHNDFQPVKGLGQSYLIQGSTQVNPPVNVVQRLSGIIKSQLSQLQSILSYADKKTNEQRVKKDRSRSRSRENRDKTVRRSEREKDHREWNCTKCSFLNFDFRDRCKRCNEAKPEPVRLERTESGQMKSYVPGPDDWRCGKCNNINYARRTQCHRCHLPRGK